MKHWKKYSESKKLVDSSKAYSISEAIALIKKTNYTKFDWSVEMAVKTNANPKYNDQMIRATTILPHGTWKSKKIAVYISEDKVDEAKKAWADVAWTETLINDIKAWKMDFDILITTPDHIRDLAWVAKQLWPKWLMPSPKAWTVVTNISQAIQEFKKWKMEFKLDKTGNINASIGKVSFEQSQLEDNIKAFLKAIEDNKPTWVKWKLIKKIVIAPTMWPWIRIMY